MNEARISWFLFVRGLTNYTGPMYHKQPANEAFPQNWPWAQQCSKLGILWKKVHVPPGWKFSPDTDQRPPKFFFDLEIEIYTTHTHTLFGEDRGDSNLCQMGGRDSLAPLGQMPSGQRPPKWALMTRFSISTDSTTLGTNIHFEEVSHGGFNWSCLCCLSKRDMVFRFTKLFTAQG